MGIKKDWTGQKFHRLTFICPTDRKYKSSRNIIWQLQCDCGSTVYAAPSEVTAGRTKSCGCYLSEICALMGKDNQANRIYDPIISSARTVWITYKDGCDFDTFFSLSQQPCHYCGREPYRTFNVGTSRRKGENVSVYQMEQGNFTYNGLDRIDSSKGHSPDNIVPCCWDCNEMKGDRTYEEFIAHITRIWIHASRI